MLIVDVGAQDGTDFSIPYAKDEGNLVYAIESTPELASQMQVHQLPNLRVCCLVIREEEDLSTVSVRQSELFADLESPSTNKKSFESLNEYQELVVRLDTFMRHNRIAEVDLLRINSQDHSFEIIKSAGSLIHNIKKISLKALSPIFLKAIASYLEASGFRLVGRQPEAEGLEENLDFIRVFRYAKTQDESEVFEVDVPHVGLVEMPKDDLVGRLLEQGLFEGPEQAFLWLYLRSGDTFFDCGAHAGIFSCIAARKLQSLGRIVGFEPVTSNATLYNKNLQRLQSKCFALMPVGLSDQVGEAPLFLGKSGLSAYSTFVRDAQAHEQIGNQSIMVEQTTLDKVVQDLSIDRVTLAKLDVEGWEISVLLGAAEAIQQQKFPLWMIEFTEENAAAAGSSTQELAKVIESFGYTLCRFDATQFRLVPEVKRSSYGYENLFAAMDVKLVNERLESASLADKNIAKDVVSRWDLASKAEEAGTLSDALQKLSHAFGVCEIDRAARLEQIQTLTRWLQESNQSRQVTEQELGRIRQELEFVRNRPLYKIALGRIKNLITRKK